MFMSFLENLYYQTEIGQAFDIVCIKKMLTDGYVDMSAFIYARIKKEDMLERLTADQSRFAVLYKDAYPKKDNIIESWNQNIETLDRYQSEHSEDLTYLEANAIVNWVYRSYRNAEERMEFTEWLFSYIKDLHEIRNQIRISRGVAFNKSKVEINFISSISDVNQLISCCSSAGQQLFFRGHANANFQLLPSVMRSERTKKHESIMYHELLINCPDDFEKCHTHLEKLVQMQHYGLPTRLLDITRNPLVALFFACESQFESYGELVLISVEKQLIKYPQSDTISILASLPLFSFEKQRSFKELANDFTIDDKEFNYRISRLTHEVRLEKPAFRAEIKREDLLNHFIVYALKNNNRIVKQDGAFILCGLSADGNLMGKFRYKNKKKTVIVIIDNKKKILKELSNFSINAAALFPEIECVAEYIKGEYS